MSEMKSLTLNDKTYDSFVDQTAREMASASFVVKSASGESITMSDAGDRKLFGFNIYGKTTQDGTPTPDAPVELVSVGDSGSVGVTVSSKNLAQVLYAKSLTTRYASIVNIKPIKLLKGVTYSVSFDTENTGVYCYINSKAFSYYRFIQDGTRKSFVFTYTEDKMMDVEPDGSTILVSRDSETSDVASGLISNVQIEVSGSTTEYEPYKGQSLTISTPNGLLGVPVPSGGNYTDANGQQWICDEVDFARGVYMQRVLRFSLPIADMDNSEDYPGWKNVGLAKYFPGGNGTINNWGSVSMCNISNSTPHINSKDGNDILLITDYGGTTQTGWKTNYPNLVFEMICSIPTPVETPLSQEELAAYTALHTYRDHTTVSNDAGAYMELEYVMDAKKYIDSLVAGNLHPATVE